MTTKNSIRKQMKFLILLTIYDDIDYQQTGITANNLLVSLADNKQKWFQVGMVSEKKDYPTTLKFELSGLEKNQILKKNYAKKYVMGKNFDDGFRQLVSELSDYLELDIELGEWHYQIQDYKEEIIEQLKDGLMPFSILSQNDTKKMNLLTIEQVTRLAQLSIELDCYE
ncbi:hypothetical protein CVD28_02285 [Bacillus sp. M6-12]|uniref:hypothetical protein n=1 Tax=Bacillus sp. M6-12 TaxID=2054166 RepID=UPI000C7561BB|nr:hypothetical protein [Bacillus sp. M6-12]PLS19261.1 hypothetical protein CVD28_02285 [Bacillus sp. M6-12]